MTLLNFDDDFLDPADDASSDFGSDFGVDYDSDSTTVSQVQSAINALGYSPALAVDGQYGPNTHAGVAWLQNKKGLKPADGTITDAVLTSLGLKSGSKPSKPSSPSKTTGPQPNIATVIASLRTAAKEMGYTLNDGLASLMIGQLRGAEGAYPGVGGTLGGTNNYGATQVTKGLEAVKKGLKGWGAFAHYDSSPNDGGYIGWYYIAPSPLEGARHWLEDNWFGKVLLTHNPQTPEEYASLLYAGHYFDGMHAGDPGHDPTSEAGSENVRDYANNIRRGMASPAELAASTNMDPATITVNPDQFAPVDKRKLTEALFDKAKHGGIGGAWSYLLPATWDDLVKSKGVVWFGPPLASAKRAGKIALFASIVGGVVTLIALFGGKKRV